MIAARNQVRLLAICTIAGAALLCVNLADVGRLNSARSLAGLASSVNASVASSFQQKFVRNDALIEATLLTPTEEQEEEEQTIALTSGADDAMANIINADASLAPHHALNEAPTLQPEATGKDYNIQVPTSTMAPQHALNEASIPQSGKDYIIEVPTGANYSSINLVNSARKVLFVHVGKAGGNTVREAYPKLSCRKHIREKRQLRKCFLRHERESSPLSRQCDRELHLGGDRPLENLEEYTTFMYAIRNPVTRAISSYSYLHHNNTNSAAAQSKHYLKEAFYKECFPTLQHLLSALHDAIALPSSRKNLRQTRVELFLKNQSPSTDPKYCQNMAIAVLEGKSALVNHINIHLKANYQFYYKKTLQAAPGTEVLVVRTEKMWDDLQELDKATGGSGSFAKMGKVANQNNNVPKQNTHDLTPEQIRDLCCILWNDIRVFQEIVNLAQNLSYRSKLETMQDVWSTCAIDDQDRVRYQPDALVDIDKDNEQQVRFSWSAWQKDQCPTFRFSI